MDAIQTERHGDHLVYVLEDRAAGSSARILATYGFNCYSFCCRIGERTFDLLRADDHFADQPSRPSGNGTPILFPFPNRIRDGRFEFRGKQYELPRNERGINAIHGLVVDRRWRAVARETPTGIQVTGQFQLSKDLPESTHLWPADFLIEMTYAVKKNRLINRIKVTNPDSKPLPWGFGTHPYFRLPLQPGGDESQCFVHAPVTETWELKDLLPTGTRRPLAATVGIDGRRPFSELKFDDVFTGLNFDGDWCTSRLIDRAAGVEARFRFDKLFRDLVIYTPPSRGAICLEPYTCVTDAINLQPRGINAGLQILQPGESAEGAIELEARLASE